MSTSSQRKCNGTVAVARSQSHRSQTPPLPARLRRGRRRRGRRRHATARRAGRSRRGRGRPPARLSRNRARSRLLRDHAHLGARHAAHAQDGRGPHDGSAVEETGRRPDVHDGPPDVPQALGPRGRRRRVREPVAVWRDRARRGQGRGSGQRRATAHDLHALLGRLRGRRHRRERRVDAAGAGLRIADQPGRALREGRVGARARARRAPAEDADEARQRQVAAALVGPGAERGRRQDARHQQGIGSRRHLLGRQLEAQQRAGVPDAQVRVVLGHQQLRPPGADLPLDDGRRRSQHVGLRRDDQFVQRHAEHQVRDVHRQQRRRGAPGVDAAHAAREGNRRQDDRRRSALHAHGGQGGRVRAHPLRHRHPVRVRHAVSHLQERLGRQAIHQRPRLRHGQGQGRRDGQVDARQGRGSLRRARSARCSRSPR